MKKKYLLIGGAGFIGSHCLDRLILDESNHITIFDNFCTGRKWHIQPYHDHPRVDIINGDIKNLDTLKSIMQGHDIVYHFAANADISKAASYPAVDFWEGTYLTNNVLETMRMANVKRIVYMSGSGVYGDRGNKAVVEDSLPELPISPYGASKLASEALISSYVHMFNREALIFRFANVIGPRQTHGVAYDFIRSLLKNPDELVILGDGTQTKSYLYIDDVIDAITGFEDKERNSLDIFNVATQEYLTVTDIAQMVAHSLGLKDIKFKYTGGKRGWKGDIPVVYFDSRKLRGQGWSNKYTSTQAMQKSIDSLIEDARKGKFCEN